MEERRVNKTLEEEKITNNLPEEEKKDYN